jgi:hypothetical protein
MWVLMVSRVSKSDNCMQGSSRVSKSAKGLNDLRYKTLTGVITNY